MKPPFANENLDDALLWHCQCFKANLSRDKREEFERWVFDDATPQEREMLEEGDGVHVSRVRNRIELRIYKSILSEIDHWRGTPRWKRLVRGGSYPD